MALRCDAGAISHRRQDGRAGMLRIALAGTDVAALPQRPCALAGTDVAALPQRPCTLAGTDVAALPQRPCAFQVLRPLVSQPARVHELATAITLVFSW